MLCSATQRRLATVLTMLVIVLGGLTACGGHGSQTDCSVTGCTVTFQRNGTSEVSVLGVTAKLVGVEGDTVMLEVGGNTVTLPVDGQTEVEGFTVRVERVTSSEVVVLVAP